MATGTNQTTISSATPTINPAMMVTDVVRPNSTAALDQNIENYRF